MKGGAFLMTSKEMLFVLFEANDLSDLAEAMEAFLSDYKVSLISAEIIPPKELEKEWIAFVHCRKGSIKS